AMSPPRLAAYLVRWEELCDAGRDVPAAELCPGEPALAAEVQHAIDALRRVRLAAAEAAPPVSAGQAGRAAAPAWPRTRAPPGPSCSGTTTAPSPAGSPTAGRADA